MNLVARQMLTAAFLLTFAVTAFAQERPKAELLDEFASFPCEFVLSHTDNLAATLQKEPAATVAIVIFRPDIQPTQAENRRRLISSTLQLRRVERDRYRFFLAAKSPDGLIRTQLWLVPPGAALPVDESTAWDEPPPDVSRPFLFGYSDEADICPTYVPKAFADLLLANPGSVGKITVTIGPDAIVERFSYAKRWIDDLVENHGVPRKRLRLIFRKSKDETGAEFWFIPARNRSLQVATLASETGD